MFENEKKRVSIYLNDHVHNGIVEGRHAPAFAKLLKEVLQEVSTDELYNLINALSEVICEGISDSANCLYWIQMLASYPMYQSNQPRLH